MSDLNYMASLLASLGFAQGYRDILGIIEKQAIYNIVNSNLETILPELIIPAINYDINYNQDVEITNQAGGGLEPNTFSNGPMSIKVSNISFPLMAHVSGMVDPTFAKLWQLAYLAVWGSPTYITSSVSGSSGAYTLISNNISDFINAAPLHLAAYITDGTNSENVIITSANKSTRTLGVQLPLANNYNANTAVLYLRYPSASFFDDPYKDPTFALASALSGYITPCMVDKLSIASRAGEETKVNLDLVVGNIYGYKQNQIANMYNGVVASRAQLPPYRIVYGNTTQISEYNTSTGTFGLPLFTDMPYTGGFLGLPIENNTIESCSISIENNLKEIHTLQSEKTGKARHAENMLPFGYYSSGRKVYGEITFKQPVNSYAFTQKIAGTSGVNKGSIAIDLQCMKITIPELTWAPGSFRSTIQDINRTLKWQMISTKIDDSVMPELEYSCIS